MNRLFLSSLAFCVSYVAVAQSNGSDLTLLKKVADKLNRLTAFSYTYTINSRYFSEDYQRDFTTKVYVKFDNRSPIGLIYQDNSTDYGAVYNGDSLLYMQKKKRIIEVTKKPTTAAFRSSTFLVNSFSTFRTYLPVLLAQKPTPVTMADTTIEGKRYATARFTLENTMLHRLGYVAPLDIMKNITYTLIIENDLPYMVLMRDNLNPGDYTRVTFTAINIAPEQPSPESWHYETYSSQYKLAKQP